MLPFLLADIPLPRETPVGDGTDAVWWLALFAIGNVVFWAVSTALWIGMLIHCYRYEPDRSFWLWMMILFPLAAVAYFVVRWLPQNEVRLPAFTRRWTRRRELDRLEMAAIQIGNPYQYVQYGDALRDVQEWRRAGQAYCEALQREPDNLQALWGAALVDIRQKNPEAARQYLTRLLAIDPQYKFGDVSLTYGRVLFELGQRDEARKHFVKHVQRWRQPEAQYLLASLQADEGETAEARRTLQSMLLDINSCPAPVARKHGIWKSKARRLLRQLSKA